mgnify:CR=1 FL=1
MKSEMKHKKSATAPVTTQAAIIPIREVASFKNKYQVLFDQASDAILAVTENGKIDSANQAAEELTGYLKSELIGSSIEVLIPNTNNSRVPERSRPLTFEMFKTPGTYEDIAIKRNDDYVSLAELTVRWVEGSDSSAKLALAVLRNVTEKKKMDRELITKHTELKDAYLELERKNAELQAMQQTLVQAGKMAALGELAAGIAHELNQPLQGIRGYAQELQSLIAPALRPDCTNASDIETYLKEVVSNVDKMATIIDYLRTFTRKSVEQYELTHLNQRVNESIKMFSRQLSSRGIRIETQFADDIPAIYGNPLQLEQVFINLISNARDAIEETGRGSGIIRIEAKKDGDFIEVLFSDNGAGMNEKTRQKIFNPFFTTKEVGKGMGLGLSLSYGILTKLHASVVIESELGKGTTFKIRIPKDFREVA